ERSVPAANRAVIGTERSFGLRGALEALVLNKGLPRKARLHALWALIGSGSLDPAFHLEVLTHNDLGFRAWGVRAAGNFGEVTPGVREKIVALARDSSPEVQLQVAIASRKIKGLDPLPVLAEVLERCGQDKIIPSITWNNLHPLLEKD